MHRRRGPGEPIRRGSGPINLAKGSNDGFERSADLVSLSMRRRQACFRRFSPPWLLLPTIAGATARIITVGGIQRRGILAALRPPKDREFARVAIGPLGRDLLPEGVKSAVSSGRRRCKGKNSRNHRTNSFRSDVPGRLSFLTGSIIRSREAAEMVSSPRKLTSELPGQSGPTREHEETLRAY